MARTNGNAGAGTLTRVDDQTVGANVAIRQLQAQGFRAKSRWHEIHVSFRKKGGGIGRRDFATHMIHWYPAKMFHRIPRVFLDNIDLPAGSKILDSFCGSGTVLLESNLRAHHAIGIDINPLAVLISRVKTTPINPFGLSGRLDSILVGAKNLTSSPNPHEILDSWLSDLARLGIHRLAIEISEIQDTEIRDFFLISLTNIVRRVSLADPAIPPLVRLREERAQTAGRRYRNALRKAQSTTIETVFSEFEKVSIANIKRMSELHGLREDLGTTTLPNPMVNASETHLPSSSIDAIITSPPYCGAQKYVRSMKLELTLLGRDPESLRQLDRQTLGTEAVSTRTPNLNRLLIGEQLVDGVLRSIYDVNPIRARMAADYSQYLFEFANECWRVLKPGGQILVTLGRSTLAGITFAADRIFSHASQATGFEYIATLIDPIRSRGLLMQRHRTAGRMDHEYVVWLRRPQ